jgi:hypothetical protein
VLLGVALGLMGLSKYHALPLGAGLGLAVVILRRHLLVREWRFYVGVLVTGIIVTLPVWIWNATNDWASFRFQGAHGFEGLSVNVLAAAQTWVGQLIMLTPMVILWALIWAFVAIERIRAGLIPRLFVVPLLAFAPLFLMLEIVTPFKQTLPHWVMPAFWMLAPVLAIEAGRRTTRAWRVNAWIFGVLVLTLPLAVGSSRFRGKMIEMTNDRPGALGEVTVWPELVEHIQRDAWYQEVVEATKSAPAHCPRPLALASLRWFWTAQIAFLMPNQPRVFDLDPERPTYYRWRDRDVNLSGCPVLIVGDRRHWYPEKMGSRLVFDSEKNFPIPGYGDLPVMMVRGRFIQN